MKVLVFLIGSDHYALPLAQVARVLPAAALKTVPLAPPMVAGLLDLHGAPTPVIDLSRLGGFTPGALCFDARIILVEHLDAEGGAHQLGLLAEHVLGIDSIAPAALAAAGLAGAPFLGQVASTANGLLQLVEPAGLLTPELHTLLFPLAGARS